MTSEFSTPEVESFLKMSMIVDKLHQQILSTSSKSQVALVESLTKRQEKSLFVIARLNVTKPEGVALKELADRLHMTVPATSVLVESMVQKDLLLRVPSPTDRRAVCIKLSAQGVEILENCRRQVDLVTQNLLDGLSKADKKVFQRVIHHVYEICFHEEKQFELPCNGCTTQLQ